MAKKKPPYGGQAHAGPAPYYTHERPDDRALHGATPPQNPTFGLSPLPAHVASGPAPYRAKPLPARKGTKPPTKPK